MKKILGLDLGTKTLGIALSDSLGIAAHGYENFTFEFGNYKKARERVLEICQKENVDEIALGYPLHMSGEVSPRAESSKRFKEDLEKENPNLKITLVDERLTTVIAHKRLMEADLSRKKRKDVIDEMSAVVILETYMQTRKGY
ncbi:MAG: Holliday junction resolvase RuvX [Bacilli bacterium]|nr:Holliday junction resolvase RuvX [Bacilli bacterium]